MEVNRRNPIWYIVMGVLIIVLGVQMADRRPVMGMVQAVLGLLYMSLALPIRRQR